MWTREAFGLFPGSGAGYIVRMSTDASPKAGATPPDWDRISADEDFRKLLARKAKFLVPATAFFVIYYFALPVLVGFAPRLMETRVAGSVNVAYLFALSQFFMAWTLAAIYVVVAMRWDRAAAAVLKKFGQD
jgi:uncharacterized membrane protein (DUF485 family)